MTLLVIGVLGLLAVEARAQDRILSEDFNRNRKQQMMRSYLREQVQRTLDARLQELEATLDANNIAAYQQRRREFLRWTLGPMPERTPLSTRVTGIIDDDGYTIEKILFASQPGFHVTANLYRPEGQGPFPAILHSCGHSENGKAAEKYQKVNELLVRHGFLVLCYDPIGQGERKQIFADDGRPAHRASIEHQHLGTAPILLGRSLASYMVWDGVRAIDYLCNRPDVDPKRIGCTGNSGGGNLTSYLMAYDDRIAAAAPGCFMTTHRRKNEGRGPGDAEQNLFAQIRDGFDHPDFIVTRAPKPTLILAATKDFVPIEGTWEAYRQAKRVYTQLGHPERVDLIEANTTHGYSRRLREGAVCFFARWLQGRQIEVFEADDVSVRSDAELQVTEHGQVRKLKDDRSIFDLFAEYEQTLATQRPKLTHQVIRRVTGIRPESQLPQLKVEAVSGEGHPRRYLLRPEPGIVLPAWHWPNGKRTPVLVVHDRGASAAMAESAAIRAAGHPVLLVDLRDVGETKTRNWRFFGADFYIAYMLGRCWLAMRTEDILVSSRWLADQHGTESISLLAFGELGPASLHAAALEPKRITDVRVEGSLASWRQLMKSPAAWQHLPNAVQGALQYYDLPDLMQFLGLSTIEP